MKKIALASLAVVLCAGSGCNTTSAKTSEKTKDVLVDQLSAYGGPQTASLHIPVKNQHKIQHKAVGIKPVPHAGQSNLPGEVRGTGWNIPWYAPDPKNPKGPRQRVLVADAKRGMMDSKKDVLAIHMSDVIATLYQADKPSATIIAPHVTTNEHDRIVIATGGVTIHSLIDPTADPKHPLSEQKTSLNSKVNPNIDSSKVSDTTVTSDKMTWDSHTTTVVCTGNAVLIVKRTGSPDLKQYSNRIIYNTETRVFHADNLEH